MYSSKRILDESGITVVPPPRLATTNLLPAPPTQLSHHTRQRHPDPPAGTDTTGKNPKKAKKTDSESNTDTSTEASESETTTSNDESQGDDEGSPNAGAFFFLLVT